MPLKNLFRFILLAIIPAVGLAANKAPVSDAAGTAEMEQRLQRLERTLNNQGLLDLLQQVEALQTEIGRLRGQVEVQNHELQQMKEQQRNLFTDMDRRMQQMESMGAAAASGEPRNLEAIEPDSGEMIAEPDTEAGAESAGETEAAESTAEAGSEAPAEETTAATETMANETPAQPEQAKVDPLKAQAEYQQAFKLLKQANYNQAIEAFTEYLDKYPVSEYSDNAQYWLGETFYVTRKYDNAINAYQALIDNFPESRKRAHGMLKLGYSYQELGNLVEAKKRLEELKSLYPGSTAARLADERLRTIKIPGSS